jgi:uncharacterized membrane protein YedE/YeeE
VNARVLSGFLAGVIFAFGLGISRVTYPETVHGALDFFGQWEPRMFVFMFSGVAVYAIFRFFAARRAMPVLAPAFRLPQQGWPTGKMFVGAAIFGAAWGYSGVCPGPALTSSLTSGKVTVFVVAMFLGIAVYEFAIARPFLRAARGAA